MAAWAQHVENILFKFCFYFAFEDKQPLEGNKTVHCILYLNNKKKMEEFTAPLNISATQLRTDFFLSIKIVFRQKQFSPEWWIYLNVHLCICKIVLRCSITVQEEVNSNSVDN